jgi:hypothetical protein
MSNQGTSTETPDAGTGGNGGGSKLSTAATVFAISLVVVFIGFLAWSWFNVNVKELAWTRRTTLLGGLEALAFAAAGAILGTTVQRQVTKKTEQQAKDHKARADRESARADANQGRADANAADAERGRAIVNSVRAKLAVASKAGGNRRSDGVRRGPENVDGGPEVAEPVMVDAQELLALDQQYEPR